MIFLPWDLWFVVIFFLAVTYETQPKFRYYFRFTMYFTIISIFALFLIPIAMFRPGDVHNTVLVAYVLGPVLNTLLGAKIHLRNEENFVEDGSIIVANHQSALDFQGMITIWPIMKRCSAIAKKEINYAGPFGLVAWLCGTIFIERRDSKRACSSMNEAGEIVKRKKVSYVLSTNSYITNSYFYEKLKLWVFPEGTRSGKEEMLPFKKGAFHLAITSQLPISPVVFSRYYFLDHEEERYDPGEVIITVLPSIPTKGMTLDQLPELVDKVRTMMMEVYRSSSAELKITHQLS